MTTLINTLHLQHRTPTASLVSCCCIFCNPNCVVIVRAKQQLTRESVNASTVSFLVQADWNYAHQILLPSYSIEAQKQHCTKQESVFHKFVRKKFKDFSSTLQCFLAPILYNVSLCNTLLIKWHGH